MLYSGVVFLINPIPRILFVSLFISNTNTFESATTTPTVKITQSGSGHALLVEDEASDSTPFIIDNSGNVIIGKTTSATAKLDVVGNAVFSGTVTGSVSITGNLNVLGTQTIVYSNTVKTDDSLLQLAANNTTGDVIDIGFYGMSSAGYHGLIREGTGGTDAAKFYLFKNLSTDPTGNTVLYSALTPATLVADVNGSMYFVPKDQVDTVDNGRQPRMQIRYTPTPFMGSAANKSSNGMITEWRTGALAEIPTSSTMQLHTDWETAQGLECLAVKHFQKYRVV